MLRHKLFTRKKSEVIKDKKCPLIRGRIVAKYFQKKKLVLAIKQILRPSFRFQSILQSLLQSST